MAEKVLRLLLVLSVSAVSVVAQLQPLLPTADLVVDVDPTQGAFAYSRIDIPAGVTVRFASGTSWSTGSPPIPVRITVAGGVRIAGTLSVSPLLSFVVTSNGPGAVATGAGAMGWMQFTKNPWGPIGTGTWSGSTGQPALHSSRYGTAIPFDLAGGSPGGTTFWNSGVFGPVRLPDAGGGGGGSLVLEAGGGIDVVGTVSAREGVGAARGSGGSILLRAMQGITIGASGVVDAGFEGIVRLDAYDQVMPAAAIQRVAPAPTVLRLPDLAETAAPTPGGTWQLRVIAPRGDVVYLAASFVPGTGTTPYGTVGIDLATAITFAVVALPTTGHDPIATFALPIPNVPQLLGLGLWVQGLDWVTNQAPRYTQTLSTSVR
jgi:hypothetical protein